MRLAANQFYLGWLDRVLPRPAARARSRSFCFSDFFFFAVPRRLFALDLALVLDLFAAFAQEPNSSFFTRFVTDPFCGILVIPRIFRQKSRTIHHINSKIMNINANENETKRNTQPHPEWDNCINQFRDSTYSVIRDILQRKLLKLMRLRLFPRKIREAQRSPRGGQEHWRGVAAKVHTLQGRGGKKHVTD
jgi:hypothetical protein